MRWGEVIGLERPWYLLSTIHVDWQLNEHKGRFTKTPPKDGSYRNGKDGNCGPIDLPPFLTELLSRQVQARPDGRCNCPDNRCGGTGQYLFLGPNSGHYQRSTYNRRVWHPAIDGFYPEEGGKNPRPARPVLVDAANRWPGTPLQLAWPYALPGQEWMPPRGQGRTRFDLDDRLALASWLPIKPGLVPHGLRHGHKTWMIEDGIPEVLQHDRLGHVMAGVKGTYSHVSQPMRETLKQALQGRWETALDERAKLSSRSPVGVLDELLVAWRERQQKMISQKSPTNGRTLIPLTGKQGL